MSIETRISYTFVSWNILLIFVQPFKIVKLILSLWAIQKQAAAGDIE